MVKRRCMLYIRTVPDAYVRMHIPEPDNFFTYVLTYYTRICSLQEEFGV